MGCKSCETYKFIITSIKTHIMPIMDLINNMYIDENSCSATAEVFDQMENAAASLSVSMDIDNSFKDNDESDAEDHRSNINFRRGASKRGNSPPAKKSKSKQRKGSDKRPIPIEDENNDDDKDYDEEVEHETHIVNTSPLSKLVIGDDNKECDVDPESTVTKLLRSVYVTPFSPITKTTDIMDHLNLFEHIKPLTKNFNVSKLVKHKPGKLPLTFVSFKIDVPRQYFDKVADQNIWQQGINATEFIAKPPSVHKSSVVKNSPLNQFIPQKQPKHRDQKAEHKQNPKQRTKNTDQSKPKNVRGKVNYQRSKQSVTKKHWPARNQPAALQFQQPSQQLAFTTPIPMSFCPYPQPNYYLNGYNDLYGGHQLGTCYRRI